MVGVERSGDRRPLSLGGAVRRQGRVAGDTGSAMVSALVALTSFTVGSVLWLARDVDMTLSIRSTADAIAFQSARAGAQQLRVEALRGDSPVAVIDPTAAARAVRMMTRDLLVREGLDGEVVAVTAADEWIRVTVRVDGPTAPTEATALAVAERR